MSSPGNDPALTDDKCMFLEVTKDDGGQNKGSNPFWWNSWDFSITDPSNQNKDVTGQPLQDGHTYTVHVRLHMAPGSQMQMCPSPDTDFVQAELYLCFPFAATTPGNPNTRLLKKFSVDPALFQPDPSITRSVVCMVSVDHVFQLNGPTDNGHRCLVARCFQHGLISSTTPTDFFVPDDQHYGQHNLNIVPASQGQPVQHAILTGNGNRKEAVSATLRVGADLHPDRSLLELIVPRLRQIEGFKKLATTPYPGGFSLRLPDFPEAKTLDQSGSEEPFYEAIVTLEPDQETTFFFEVDTSDDEPGIARIYHITHIENQRVIGGVTVVTVAS